MGLRARRPSCLIGAAESYAFANHVGEGALMAQTSATGRERDARFGSILPIDLPLANGRYLRIPVGMLQQGNIGLPRRPAGQPKRRVGGASMSINETDRQGCLYGLLNSLQESIGSRADPATTDEVPRVSLPLGVR